MFNGLNKYKFIIICLLFASEFQFAQTPLPTVDLSQLKYGLKDSLTNAVILPAKYDYINTYYKGFAIVRNDRTYGFIDETGEEKLPLVYQELKRVSSKHYLFQKDNKYGLFDTNGETVLPNVFKSLILIEDRALVHNGSNYGLIDLSGNILLPFEYDGILIEDNQYGQAFLNPHFIRVKKGKTMYAVNLSNQPMFPNDYLANEIELWSDSVFFVKNEGGFDGLLSFALDTLISFGIYEAILPYHNGLFAVKKNNLYGFMNLQLDTVIPIVYDQALSLQNNRATVKKNRNWGMISTKGDTLIPFYADEPILLKYNRAAVKLNGSEQYAIINENGDFLNRLRFDEVHIHKEVILVRIGQQWGALNSDGLMIMPVEFDEIIYKKGSLVVIVDHLQGLYDLEGERILKPEYEFIYPTYDDPYIMVRKEGSYGYVDRAGKVVIPIKFENARNFKFGRASVLFREKSFEIGRDGMPYKPLINK